MSKAFTSEETAPDLVVIAPRAPLPDGIPNYVTPRGLELLRTERRELDVTRARLELEPDESARATALAAWIARAFDLDQRIASAQRIDPTPGASAAVRFGSRVTVADDAGRRRTYEIVGVDEADPSQGRIAFLSPVAKALLGASVGDAVLLEIPGKQQELEILEVE